MRGAKVVVRSFCGKTKKILSKMSGLKNIRHCKGFLESNRSHLAYHLPSVRFEKADPTMFLYPYILVPFLLVYFLLFTSDFAAEPHLVPKLNDLSH